MCLGILQTFIFIPESGCKQHRSVPFPGTAGESCKAAVELLGVDSVLSRQWPGTLANFQVMLQNQNAVLEELAAKILPLFPTVFPLFIVSVECCSSAVVCVSQDKCLSLRQTLYPVQKSKFV